MSSDMLRRTPIDVDGKVSLPLVGEVKAAGITISALRAQVRELMSAKEYHQHSGEGAHSTDIVWPDQIGIDIEFAARHALQGRLGANAHAVEFLNVAFFITAKVGREHAPLTKAAFFVRRFDA